MHCKISEQVNVSLDVLPGTTMKIMLNAATKRGVMESETVDKGDKDKGRGEAFVPRVQ